MELKLPSHQPGDNITIMNTLSGKLPQENGRTVEGLILVYKDCDTGLKYKQEYIDPDYTYYLAKPDKRVSYNRLFIDKNDVQAVTVPHKQVEKDIAINVGKKQWFYDNVSNGNFRENNKIHCHPDVFGSDMHIEDHYRFAFNETYKNEPCPVTKSYLDIEADTISMRGDFPQLGECPVNAVTLIMQETNQVYTFLLETPTNDQIPEFKKRVEDVSVYPELKEFVTNAVGGPEKAAKFGIDKFNFNFLMYPNEKEIDMISDIFKAINTFKPDFTLAWNMSFDIPYLMERIRVLGYEPSDIICHPDFSIKFCQYVIDERNKNEFAERGDYGLISSYTTYIDQMIQYASRRKGRGRPLSFGLDYIGELVAGVHKLDYKHITTNISELPYKDYKTFVFYNIMDVIVQVCIESMTGDIEYMFSKAIVNNTRYPKVHRQTIYLTNRGIKEFYKDGFIMGNNVNKFNDKPTKKFPGAFVADMRRVNDFSRVKIGGVPVQIFNNLDDFDYSSLYPSNIRQFNVAAHTQIGMIIIPNQVMQFENRQKDDSYSRSGQFLEDMQSHVWLESASRWFKLGNIMDLIHDIEEFYTTIANPSRGLRLYNDAGYIDPIIPINKDLPMSPAIFYDNPREPVFVPFDKTKAEEWRAHAIANPYQQFK